MTLNLFNLIFFGCGPPPATVTTRIVTCLIGDSDKPSFATVTEMGPHPIYYTVYNDKFLV